MAKAKIKMRDSNTGYVLVWYGGHGIHAYDEAGNEVSFWNTGDFSKNEATAKEIRASMMRRIKEGDYP